MPESSDDKIRIKKHANSESVYMYHGGPIIQGSILSSLSPIIKSNQIFVFVDHFALCREPVSASTCWFSITKGKACDS